MNGSKSRPSLPATVKQQLRKESGYGCCICGFPVIQYQHIIPWAVEAHFRPEDMMALCPAHHDEADKGPMAEEEQRKHKAHPYNIARGYVGGQLRINQGYAGLSFGGGGVLFVGNGSSIRVDGHTLLKIEAGEQGRMLLSAHLETKEGEILAIIDNNDWVSGDPSVWDMTASYGRIKIWSASRKLGFELQAGKKEPAVLTAELWKNGQQIRINKAGVHIPDPDGGSNRFLGLVACVGLNIDVDSSSGVMRLSPNRGRSGYTVIERSRVGLLYKALAVWNHLDHPALCKPPRELNARTIPEAVRQQEKWGSLPDIIMAMMYRAGYEMVER
jgi:hypothetical protein